MFMMSAKHNESRFKVSAPNVAALASALKVKESPCASVWREERGYHNHNMC